MTISANVVLCSQLSENGSTPIWTLQLRYPRFIHAEFLTHRAFSRNASSSRAIPVKKLIEDIRTDPAMPSYWGRNQKGMQATVELSDDEIKQAKLAWRAASEKAIESAESLMALGVHKQTANRVLEPFSHINVVMTATDFDNWFALRDHPDAQPEIRILAQKMRQAMTDVYWDDKMNYVEPGEWHIPYIRPAEQILSHQSKIAISVARCARVSYMTFDGMPSTVAEDIALYEKLIVAKPAHASPCEHQASAHLTADRPDGTKWSPRSANFTGWRSLRTELEASGEL